MYCGISPHDILAQSNVSASSVVPVTKGKTLVAIFLRGGMDGLNFIVPYKDPGYYKLRKSIAIAEPGKENGLLDLDGFFGLHPRAAALEPWLKSGTATALHAVGYSLNTRSHFEEQDTWETGVIGNTISSDGWLNRHLLTSKGHGIVRAVALGDSLPRILRGEAPAFAMRGIEDMGLPTKDPKEQSMMAAALEHAYCTDPGKHREAARDLLQQTAKTTFAGLEELKKVGAQAYQPKVEYPKSGLGKRMMEAARLIKSDIGVEVIEVDYGGWDTHQGQGGVVGNFGNLVQELSEALAAFAADMEGQMDDVLVMTMSDFGRTAAENGTNGTDHGWANCMLAMGGPVRKAGGGQARPVLSQWPGLLPEQLHEKRDLLHTTDFRDVLGEVVSVHLGNEQLKKVLPSHEFKPVRLIG